MKPLNTGMHYPLRLGELPKGWEVGYVGDFCAQVQPGFACGTHSDKDIGIAHLRPMNIDRRGRLDYSEIKYVGATEDRKRLALGDVLFNNTNSPELIGKTAWVDQSANGLAFSNHMTRLTFERCVDSRFAAAQLHFLWMARYFLHRCVKHVNQASLSSMDLSNTVPFIVPPLTEQHRVVDEIEELFSELDKGIESLQNAREQLKAYRQAVLKQAFEGKLTAKWRKEHAAELKPAEELLETIRAEREQGYERHSCEWGEAIRALGSSGLMDERPKRSTRHKEPEPLTATELRELPMLPNEWAWTMIGSVGEVLLGRQRSPKDHFGPNMHPYLRVANVFDNRIDVSDVMEMNFSPEEFEVFSLRRGDILLNEGQSLELVGRPAMYRDEVPGACFQNTLIRFRAAGGMEAKYCLYVFLWQYKSQRYRRLARWTTSIAHLGASRFERAEFPVCPPAEQREIVEQVESRLSIVDQLELTIDLGLQKAELLRQSILRKAFEGKLVPQDASDEPASVLLERIRVRRAKPQGNPSKRKK